MNNEEFDYEYLQLVEQQLELDDMQSKVAPCWEGYEMIGMKKGKNGKLVPNCVPIEKKEGKPLKDPDGGLTAARRKYYKRAQRSNLKQSHKTCFISGCLG